MDGAGTCFGRVMGRIRRFLEGTGPRVLVSVYTQPDYRQMEDEDALVERACEVIRADMASNEPDIVPAFLPDFGTVSTAALYGGERLRTADGGQIHIRRVVQRVDALPELAPCPFEASDYQRALDLYGRVCGRLGTDEVCLRTPDFQGPLNTLALLMDQTELMTAMMERPEVIHAALGSVTDALIAYTRRFRDAVGAEKVVGNIWPYTVLPDGRGVSITQDYLPLLGPGHYAEFELPQVKRIADAFGGVFIHCCGRYAHHLETLRTSGMKILGLEVHHPETTVQDVYAVFGDSLVITPYVAPKGQSDYPSLAALVRSWAGQPCARGRYWFCTCAGWEDGGALRAEAERVCRLPAD